MNGKEKEKRKSAAATSPQEGERWGKQQRRGGKWRKCKQHTHKGERERERRERERERKGRQSRHASLRVSGARCQRHTGACLPGHARRQGDGDPRARSGAPHFPQWLWLSVVCSHVSARLSSLRSLSLFDAIAQPLRLGWPWDGSWMIPCMCACAGPASDSPAAFSFWRGSTLKPSKSSFSALPLL